MISKNKEFVCISLSEESLKVAYVKGVGNSLSIVNVVNRDVSGITELELPKIVQSSLGGINVRGSNLACVVPPGMITTKNIEIPSTNEEEISSIVNLQAGRHTPFSRDEIQVGYINLGVYKANYTKVLLVIANKNLLKTQLSVFERAGLRIRRVLFAPEGIASLYANNFKMKEDASPSAIIDINRSTTEFLIIFKGKVIASRSIPSGRVQFASDPSGTKTKLVDEIGKTLEAYKNEDIDQLPARYILTGNDSLSDQLAAEIKDKLGWNVEAVSYIDSIKATKGALTRLANAGDNSFLDVIASAAQMSDSTVNLLPDEILLQKSIEAQGKELIKAALLGFSILILVIAGFVAKLYFHNSYLKLLSKNTNGIHEKVVALENLSARTKVIQDYIGGRMISLDTIKELYSSVPKEVYLTGIYMDEKGNISLQGISDIGSVVYDLGNKLKESKLFKSVEIKSTTSKKDRGKDATAFEITLRLKNAPDEEKEKPKTKKAEE
ncbi:MAG: pilus assembly protein PilM [Candidatus Omnitrophica bacterium]|nr:pilus assembly protein PilM [Candidatus Omnitrophota bacterium]